MTDRDTDRVQGGMRETARVEAFSDGVFAIAITLLILEIKVPPIGAEPLAVSLPRLWPSYLAFLASFLTGGVMWLNHHRLFNLVGKSDDGLIGLNLLLLLGVTWLPFPTALLAAHLRRPDERLAALMYATSFFFISVVFQLIRRYAITARLFRHDVAVHGVSKQYAIGPLMYLVLMAVALYSGTIVLILSALYAVYFALPPSLWSSRAKSQQLA